MNTEVLTSNLGYAAAAARRSLTATPRWSGPGEWPYMPPEPLLAARR